MRKLTGIMLALILMLTSCLALAQEGVGDTTSQMQTQLNPTDIARIGRPQSEEPVHITVGSTTKVNGSFFTGLWGNNTSDIDVRTLIHGYSTVVWNSQVEFIVDTMVVENMDQKSIDGNTVYTMKLQEDLVYNDGETKITAKDYVFSLLLLASPELSALGAESAMYTYLEGYDAYHSGQSKTFSGVRLIDDYTFSLTIKTEYEPFFYGLSYAQVTPYPMTILAPQCDIADTGDGSYFINTDPNFVEVPFSEALLAETILNQETGYMHHPALTSGSYMITSYDPESGRVDFALNPHYKGNYEGVKPMIDTLSLAAVTPDNMIAKLQSGEVDVLNKCVEHDAIVAGMGLMDEDIAMTNYARLGYGFLAFACEEGPTQFEAVRQAIAYSFDKDAFVEEYLDGFGMTVNGYYGIGQWMTLAAIGALSPMEMTEEEQSAWDALNLDSLNPYTPEADKALALLVGDGWILNENGQLFSTSDTVRYKDVDGELMRLTIRFAKSQDNVGAQLAIDQLLQTLPQLGVEFIVDEIPFTQMLSDYYREDGKREYQMNFMATNFVSNFDPYYTFAANEEVEGAINISGIRDERLIELAWDMHATEPMDYLDYMQKWLLFQERFNEILPTLPIYSNIYFDFYSNWLQNYSPNAYYSWPTAMLYAYYEEPTMFGAIQFDANGMDISQETVEMSADDNILILD